MMMKKSELKKILREHKKWLEGKGGKRAYLSGVNLINADLHGIDLSNANLHGAELRYTDLTGAKLINANLHGANLQLANLHGANLRGADLSGANLLGANLQGADLHEACLYEANLYEADMQFADLRDASLLKADLRNADLLNSNINHYTKFSEPESIRKGMILVKPMTGYKKTYEGVIIKAKIPVGAVVFSINNDKCRTNIAKIVDMKGKKILHSQFSPTFSYKKGQTIIITDFDLNPSVECSTGFHFFRTRKEAENY